MNQSQFSRWPCMSTEASSLPCGRSPLTFIASHRSFCSLSFHIVEPTSSSMRWFTVRPLRFWLYPPSIVRASVLYVPPSISASANSLPIWYWAQTLSWPVRATPSPFPPHIHRQAGDNYRILKPSMLLLPQFLFWSTPHLREGRSKCRHRQVSDATPTGLNGLDCHASVRPWRTVDWMSFWMRRRRILCVAPGWYAHFLMWGEPL